MCGRGDKHQPVVRTGIGVEAIALWCSEPLRYRLADQSGLRQVLGQGSHGVGELNCLLMLSNYSVKAVLCA